MESEGLKEKLWLSNEEKRRDPKKAPTNGTQDFIVESEMNDEGTGSEDGDGARSSVSSKSTSLLRLGLGRTGHRLEPTLKYLVLSILGLLICLSVMGICVQVLWGMLSIGRYHAVLQILSSPVQLTPIIGSYSAAMLGHLNRPFLYESEEERTQEEARIVFDIQRQTNLMETLRSLVFKQQSTFTDKEQLIFKQTPVTVFNVDGESLSLSLLEAIQQFTVAFSTLLAKNATELRQDTRALQFLRNNERSNLTRAWGLACEALLETQAQNVESSKQIEFLFMVSALSLVGGMTLLVFLPITYMIHRQRANIYSLFEKIEPKYVRDVCQECITKLKNMSHLQQGNSQAEVQELMEMVASKKEVKTENRGSRLRVHFGMLLTNRTSVNLISILVFTAGYFAGFYFWWIQLSEHVLDGIDHRVYLTQLRESYVRTIALNAVQWDERNNSLSIDTAYGKLLEEQLWPIEETLYSGSAQSNVRTNIRVLKGGSQIMTSDVCALFDATHLELASHPSKQPCREFYYGLLTQGTHETMIAFIAMSQNLHHTYRTQGPSVVREKLLFLKELADRWIPQINEQLDNWLEKVFTDELDNAANARRIGTVLYILVLLVATVLVYVPTVKRMNCELQQTRNLLTIVPHEVIESSKALQEQVRSIALRMIQAN
jgi:hypothetical protein